MRKKVVAGNWKMNKALKEGISLCEEIRESLKEIELKQGLEVILFPPYLHLSELSNRLETTKVRLGAQNVHHEASGAYTGEISSVMLASVGVEYCLVGHSERRTYQKESNAELIGKVKSLLENKIKPIFCVGESLQDREGGREKEVIADQLSILYTLSQNELSDMIIAYEPVWAIGTGKTATAQQAQEMHAHIRSLLAEQYQSSLASRIPILYGGSCNPENASELFAKADVDGGLIGGASLKASSFVDIIQAI